MSQCHGVLLDLEGVWVNDLCKVEQVSMSDRIQNHSNTGFSNTVVLSRLNILSYTEKVIFNVHENTACPLLTFKSKVETVQLLLTQSIDQRKQTVQQ